MVRLHAKIEREQRSIDALEAATSEAQVEAALALRAPPRSRRIMLVATGAVAVASAAGASAFVASHHGGAKAAPADARPAPADARIVRKLPPACPAVTLPPPPDRPVEGSREIRFEDGGGFSSLWFSMYHPPGFSQAPLYTQHYELFTKNVPHVRIRVGNRWEAESGDPRFFLTAAKLSLRGSPGFKDVGTRSAVVSCQPAIRWEYERAVDGERLRAVRYFFVTWSRIQHHTAYEILFEAPAKTWGHWRPVFAYVKRTFRVDWRVAGTARPAQPR